MLFHPQHQKGSPTGAYVLRVVSIYMSDQIKLEGNLCAERWPRGIKIARGRYGVRTLINYLYYPRPEVKYTKAGTFAILPLSSRRRRENLEHRCDATFLSHRINRDSHQRLRNTSVF